MLSIEILIVLMDRGIFHEIAAETDLCKVDVSQGRNCVSPAAYYRDNMKLELVDRSYPPQASRMSRPHHNTILVTLPFSI